jgi:mannose-6-phosphate isomerase-like protein (cupin superfamily)
MANPGDRFEMVDGSAYEVVRTSAQTGGGYVEMIFHQPPGAVPPPPHVHSGLVEEYEVIEGRFDVMVNGEWSTLGPGQSASVPEGAVHTFRNRSGSTVRARNFHRPAARFEDYIEHIYSAPARAGGEAEERPPACRSTSRCLMLEYPETLAPGRRRERVGMKALAGLGRLLRMSTAV